MKINLYREDGYSLWVLLNCFPRLLSALEDDTPPADPNIVVFYRPSIGRGGSATEVRKQFGEFDILIGTPQGVYPIESKRDKCSELNRRTRVMTLKEKQIRRHRVFRTYRLLWQKYRPSNWMDFRSAAMNEFVVAHPGCTMAESRNLLGRNLNFVLRSLENCGDKIRDTVLLFQTGRERAAFTNDQGFQCITMPLEMIPGSDFLSIEGPSSIVTPI